MTLSTMPYFPRASVATPDARVRAALSAHYDAIWRFLRRLGVADVEDAAQRVFLVLARRLGDVPADSERAFLFSSAVRVAADCRKHQARSPVELSLDGELDSMDHAPTAEDELDARRLRAWLDQVLDTLTEEHRAVLVLVDLEEQTMAETSEVLGIPAGTVASRLRKARETFEAAAAALKHQISEGGRA